jgi:dethiobiotin synthetase
MSRAVLIVGTDTEIGKTYVTGNLCRTLRESGTDCGVYKPVQSGSSCLDDPNSDASRLKALGGLADPVERLCAYSFPAPLAPPVAARRAGVKVTLKMLLSATREALSAHDLTLVETAGGLLSPTAENATVADFAEALQAPVLLIARAGLGTVNHTLLTLEAIRARNLQCLGVVLNQSIGALAEADNPAMIKDFGKVDVIAQLAIHPSLDAFAPIAQRIRNVPA